MKRSINREVILIGMLLISSCLVLAMNESNANSNLDNKVKESYCIEKLSEISYKKIEKVIPWGNKINEIELHIKQVEYQAGFKDAYLAPGYIIAGDKGSLFISDYQNDCIIRIDADNSVNRIIESLSKKFTSDKESFYYDFCLDVNENIYLISTGNMNESLGKVFKFNREGKLLEKIGKRAEKNILFNNNEVIDDVMNRGLIIQDENIYSKNGELLFNGKNNGEKKKYSELPDIIKNYKKNVVGSKSEYTDEFNFKLKNGIEIFLETKGYYKIEDIIYPKNKEIYALVMVSKGWKEKISYDFLAVNIKGNIEGIIKTEEVTEIYNPTIKHFSTDKNGNIFQLVTTKEGLKIIKYIIGDKNYKK